MDGFRETNTPDGETTTERLTLPAKPFRLVRFMTDELVNPAGIVREVGLATNR